MNEPPPYPRIPYLWAPRAEPDAPTVPKADVDRWFSDPVIAEEKLDGANVAVWPDDSARPRVAGRSGSGGMDRSGQLGRLRAWVAEHFAELGTLLGDSHALYGEWLWLAHSIRYERLPAWLIVLDLWSADTGFLSVGDRDERVLAAGLSLPPRLFHGVLGGGAQLERLAGPSAFGAPAAEGVMLRRRDERCKFVPESFRRLDDDEWRAGRPTNQIATSEPAR
jgi:hypothetical protein